MVAAWKITLRQLANAFQKMIGLGDIEQGCVCPGTAGEKKYLFPVKDDSTEEYLFCLDLHVTAFAASNCLSRFHFQANRLGKREPSKLQFVVFFYQYYSC